MVYLYVSCQYHNTVRYFEFPEANWFGEPLSNVPPRIKNQSEHTSDKDHRTHSILHLYKKTFSSSSNTNIPVAEPLYWICALCQTVLDLRPSPLPRIFFYLSRWWRWRRDNDGSWCRGTMAFIRASSGWSTTMKLSWMRRSWDKQSAPLCVKRRYAHRPIAAAPRVFSCTSWLFPSFHVSSALSRESRRDQAQCLACAGPAGRDWTVCWFFAYRERERGRERGGGGGG